MILRALRSAILVAAISVIPASAFAQTPWFVGGLGGVTFGTVSSGAVGAQFGVQIRPNLFVIGEVGRMGNILPQNLKDILDSISDDIDEPVTFDISTPATYAFGGVRYVQPRQPVSPFVEAGVGFARVTLNVNRVEALGVNLTSLFRQFLEASGADFSDTEFLLAIGGGVHRSLRDSLGIDVGYRYTRIATEGGGNTSMIYAALKFTR